MITLLIMKNFRGIVNETIPLKHTTVIAGKNDTCKTTMLNALNFVITDTVITDNPGIGENDRASLIRKGMMRGDILEVTIEIDNGARYTKQIKPTYNQDGKITGYPLTVLKNGVKVSKIDDWKNDLYKDLNYEPTLKSIPGELLFTDPLRALMKADPKDLRKLLTQELGCNVSLDDVYALGFDDLRAFGTKYSGDFMAMRKSLKSDIKTIKKDYEYLERRMNEMNGVEEWKDTALKNLEIEKEDLYSAKATLNSSDSNIVISGLKNKRKEIELSIEKQKNEFINQINSKLIDLNRNIKNEEADLYNAKLSKTKDLDLRKTELESKIKLATNRSNTYKNQADELRTYYSSLVKKQAQSMRELEDTSREYNEVLNSKFTDTVTCPGCGLVFVPDIEKENLFNFNKKTKLDQLTAKASFINREINDYDKKINATTTNGKNAMAEYEKAAAEYTSLVTELADVSKKIAAIENEPVDNSKLNDLKAEYCKYREMLENPTHDADLDSQIIDLNEEIEKVSMNAMTESGKQLDEIATRISAIELKIQAEHIKQSNWLTKLETKTKFDNCIKTLNNTEALLGRVQAFIRKQIELVNEKAFERTGIRFVMLEENLKDDNMTECCYATLDNIPFMSLNTSKKYILGCQFIDKVKEIVGSNDLPVLADKLEGLDSIEKIGLLTNGQIVATRVTNTEREIIGD